MAALGAGPETTSSSGGSGDDTFLAVGCTTNGDCGSGFCVAGVCCNTACTDLCSACDLPGSVGTCTVKENGASCDDGDACTLYESCLGGTCVPSWQITCPPPAYCLGEGTCDHATGGCTWPNAPNGSSCDDFNACTQTDSCVNGICVGSNPIVCEASDECHAPGTCVPVDVTWTCEPSPTVLPSCNLGAFDYDRAGRLIRDRQAELHYDPYDQLREVVPIASPPPVANLPVEDLESPDEFQASAGRSNAAGDVPVAVITTSFATHTFLFEGVGIEDLNATLGMSGLLQGNAIGDSKAVAGSWVTQDFAGHAFRYDAAGFHDLFTGDSTVAYDVNAANEVAGVFSASGHLHGFVHTDASGFQPIGTLGGANSWAWGIDNDGVVSASAQLAGAPPSGFGQYGHAALYDAVTGLRDLNNVADPYAAMTLVAANQKQGDWVVGGALDPYGVERAYRLRLSSGAIDNIGWGGSSFATAVNAHGDAVGWAYLEESNTTQVAWVFTARTGLAKLNDLIDPGSGWNLQTATGIDELGDIVGTGTHNGRQSAFRLRIPAHSTGTGGPAVAEVHTYGYDGLRTSTTTAPGTGSANTQVWFTQDYSEHDGKREHYVRIGNRIVAKVTLQPPMGGGGGTGVLIDPRRPPVDLGDLIAKILLALLLAGGLATVVTGSMGKKRRPAWVSAAAGPVVLFFLASCDKVGTDRRSAETVWQRIEVVYFHHGIAAGPVLTTNADGTLKEERRYEPFGQPVDANVGGTLGAIDFRREQQNSLGKLTNPNTGWSHHGARWMQPQAARWISPDPALFASAAAVMASPNPYAYVRGNPTVYWDRSGAYEEPVHGALTYKLAIYAGFSVKDAAKIALADAGIDHDPRTRPLGDSNVSGYLEGAQKMKDGTTHQFHFLPFGEALGNVHEEMKEKQYMGMQEFGKALHTLQDVGFSDAPGPHARGVHQFGSLGGHGYYRHENGRISTWWRHDADHAWSDPKANRKELREIWEVMKEAAHASGATGVPDDAAASKAIDECIGADTTKKVGAFLNAPVGDAPSYRDQVQSNYDSNSPFSGVYRYPADKIEYGTGP
ncbi:MAG TPA: RHS repeat-associated core domain-containing protein [Polyangia bacterium]